MTTWTSVPKVVILVHVSFRRIHESQCQLRGHELQQLLTLCFHNPEYAEEQYRLSGVVQGPSIYKYS